MNRASLYVALLAASGVVHSGCCVHRGFVVRYEWSCHAHRLNKHGSKAATTGCTDNGTTGGVTTGGGATVGGTGDCGKRCDSEGFIGGRAEELPPPPNPATAPMTRFHPVPTCSVFGPALYPADDGESGLQPIEDEPPHASDQPAENHPGNLPPDVQPDTDIQPDTAGRANQARMSKASSRRNAPGVCVGCLPAFRR
jgi:hypothetical protein